MVITVTKIVIAYELTELVADTRQRIRMEFGAPASWLGVREAEAETVPEIKMDP